MREETETARERERVRGGERERHVVREGERERLLLEKSLGYNGSIRDVRSCRRHDVRG